MWVDSDFSLVVLKKSAPPLVGRMVKHKGKQCDCCHTSKMRQKPLASLSNSGFSEEEEEAQ